MRSKNKFTLCTCFAHSIFFHLNNVLLHYILNYFFFKSKKLIKKEKNLKRKKFSSNRCIFCIFLLFFKKMKRGKKIVCYTLRFFIFFILFSYYCLSIVWSKREYFGFDLKFCFCQFVSLWCFFKNKKQF